MDRGVSNNGKRNQDGVTALERIVKRAWNSDEKKDIDVLPRLRLCYLVDDYDPNEG